MENDKQLVKDFLAGDEAAFSELVGKYLKPVYNFLHTIVRDRDILDDLTQETFLKAWKNLKKFDQEKNFKTWLFTIAKNTALDYLKKKKTVPFAWFENDEGYNKLENIEDEEKNLEELIGKKELEKNLEEKLNQLSADYRLLLLLRYKDGFSLQEIGDILGRPYNTIKSQHQRALASLKKEILNG